MQKNRLIGRGYGMVAVQERGSAQRGAAFWHPANAQPTPGPERTEGPTARASLPAPAAPRRSGWAIRVRNAALLVLVFGITSTVAADAERRAAAGEMKIVKGQRVLRLYGNSLRERGFANGYLSGEQIIRDLEAAINSLPGFGAASFEADYLPWMHANFTWDPEALEELDGVFEGLSARCGGFGPVSPLLKRAVTRDDLLGMNALADYYGPACSAFAAWGDRTTDGRVIHARTLDFPIGPDAVAAQLILANEALPERGAGHPARKAFLAIGWPGMIAHYTAMNADGLVLCLHDGMNVRGHASPKNCVARGVLLRRILETVDVMAGDPAQSAARLISAAPSACGNLFHLSWPLAAAQASHTQPSAILEFDPLGPEPVVRRPEQAGMLVLTNHFCVLNHSVECERFACISGGLDWLLKAHEKVGRPEARKLLLSAEQPVGAHSVYFFPDTLDMDLALTQRNVMSVRVTPTAFAWSDFFSTQRR